MTKILAHRIGPFLSSIIPPNQTAYVKGRFIGEGIRTIEGIINHITENKLDAFVLAIDFEAAFDSLEWSFTWKVLSAYGIPDFFIDAIKTVYTNIETCVINGGTTTPFLRYPVGPGKEIQFRQYSLSLHSRCCLSESEQIKI